MVGAGFQGDVGGGTGKWVAFGASIAKRHDFGVWAAGLLGKSLSQDMPFVGHDHTPYTRIGIGKIDGIPRQRQRLLPNRREGSGSTYCQQAFTAFAPDLPFCPAWLRVRLPHPVSPACGPPGTARRAYWEEVGAVLNSNV